MQQWIWQAGGEVLSDDLTQSPIDSPEAIQGAQFVADLINVDQCTPGQSVIFRPRFWRNDEGRPGCHVHGRGGRLRAHRGQAHPGFLLPQGPVNRANWAYIAGISVNAATQNPDAAFAAFMDLSQAIHEWKVPAPRISLATAEGIAAATPYKEISAANIIANLEHMRARASSPAMPSGPLSLANAMSIRSCAARARQSSLPPKCARSWSRRCKR